jgi:hypothetical protein
MERRISVETALFREWNTRRDQAQPVQLGVQPGAVSVRSGSREAFFQFRDLLFTFAATANFRAATES